MPEQHTLNKPLLNQKLSWTINICSTIELAVNNLIMKSPDYSVGHPVIQLAIL